jgi:hypothetical protein
MGLTEIEAVAEQDCRGDCNLRPATTEGEKEQLSSVKLNSSERAFTNRSAAADAQTSTLAESTSQNEIGERGRGKEGREKKEETTHNWSLMQTSRIKEQ